MPLLKAITPANLLPLSTNIEKSSIFIINAWSCYPTYKGENNIYADQIVWIPVKVEDQITIHQLGEPEYVDILSLLETGMTSDNLHAKSLKKIEAWLHKKEDMFQL